MTEPSQRSCVLHVGTHKTASTAIQLFLDENRLAFESNGLYLVRTGREGELPYGNHRLAWDLLADEKSPLLDVFTRELASSPNDAAIVTAEDFSLLSRRASALESLFAAIRAADFEPNILIYLRPQGAFAESMYGQRVHSDTMIRPIDRYIDEILSTRAYQLEKGFTLEFDYDRLLRSFETFVERERILVRSYRSDLDSAYIFKDFLAALSIASPAIDFTKPRLNVAHATANLRLRYVQLLATAFMHIFPHIPLPDDPMEFLQRYAPAVPRELAFDAFRIFSRDEHLAFIEAFATSNRAIEERYGITLSVASPEDVASADDPRWEVAKLHRDAYDRCVEEWLEQKAHADGDEYRSESDPKRALR